MTSKIPNIIPNFDSWQLKWVGWFQYTYIGKIYYAIKGGVPSLWRWRKHVWKDRDYDRHYIFESLKFKIDNTANYIEKNKRFVGWENEVKWMRLTTKLIDRVNEGYYESEYQEEVEKIWGKRDYKFTPVKWDSKGEPSLYEMDFVYDNVKSEADKKAVDKMISDGLKSGRDKHTKARKLLFTIIESRIEGWWD
jgi:hypothetical protein